MRNRPPPKTLPRLFLATISFFAFGSALFGQVLPSPEDPDWRYQAYLETSGRGAPLALGLYRSEARARDISGPWMQRPSSSVEVDQEPRGRILPTQWGLTDNTSFPVGFNQGGLWTGVGVTTWMNGGLEGEAYGFAIRLATRVSWTQNLDFRLGPSALGSTQPLADLQGRHIDAPQRFGVTPFYSLDWAASGLAYQTGPFLVTASTENLWFGPGFFNSLLLSSHAKGFPHLQIGWENWATPWGRVETNLVLGRLGSSSYGTLDQPFQDRFFGGLFASYVPPFFPQLTLGFGRTIFSYWKDLSWVEPLTLFSPKAIRNADDGSVYADSELGNGKSHQHASLTWRLLFPEVGFETYGEWAKNDFSAMMRGYLTNPDHMQTFTLGLRKTFDIDPLGWMAGLSVELTDAGQSKESLINFNGLGAGGEFYNHFSIREGYTNEGMVLGASIGNGASQTFAADIYAPWGNFGLSLMRFNPHSSYLYSMKPLPKFLEYRTDTQYLWTLRAGVWLGVWYVSGLVEYDYDFNRYFEDYWGPNRNDTTNWRFSLLGTFQLANH